MIFRVETQDSKPNLVAHDVSMGGMQVTSPAPRWPGDLVRVRFQLPGERVAIRATCRVVSLFNIPVGVGMCLQFLKLAPEARQLIKHYVDGKPLPDWKGTSDRIDAWIEQLEAHAA